MRDIKQWAPITGASSGLGKVFAQEYAKKGDNYSTSTILAGIASIKLAGLYRTCPLAWKRRRLYS